MLGELPNIVVTVVYITYNTYSIKFNLINWQEFIIEVATKNKKK